MYTQKHKEVTICLALRGRDTKHRIAACNRYYKLIYIFSIFKIPTNVPANTLDAIGLLWMRMYTFGTKQTFTQVEEHAFFPTRG